MDGIPLLSSVDTSLIPLDLINPDGDLAEILSNVIITDYTETTNADESVTSEYSLSFSEEVSFGLLGLDGFELVFGGGSDPMVIVGWIAGISGGYSIYVSGGFQLRFSSSIFKPVVESAGGYVLDPDNEYLSLLLSSGIELDEDFEITFTGGNSFPLTPVMIGDSGVVIEGEIAFDFSESESLPESQALGLSESWKGAVFKTLTVHLPDSINVPLLPNELVLDNFHIGNGGITGDISGNWSNSYDSGAGVFTGDGVGDLLGIPFALSELLISLKQNTVSGSSITGSLKIPFFDAVIEVEIGLSNDGDVAVGVSSDTGLLTLEKPGVISIEVSSLEFVSEDGEILIKLSGEVTPLLSGIDWPTFELKSLAISSDGRVKVDGGWIELPEQKTLDFYGFKVEISRLGFGSDEADSIDYNWIGFAGGIQLVQSLPLRGGVEGLKVMWDQSGTPKLKIGGVYLEFEIPDVLTFDGTVNFKDEDGIKEFRGGVDVTLIPLNFGLNAQFITGQTNDFNYFYIFIDLDLPVGVPLGPPIVGVYGLAGLYGHNMTLDYNSLIDYGSGEDPPAMTDVSNWLVEKDAKAFGAGLTVGTLPDVRFLAKAKAIFAVLIPGPVLLIEGYAGMISLGDNYPFKVLAVIDPASGTFLMNISATYQFPKVSGDLLDVAGSAEAFFSAADPADWHLYLGQDTPDSKRIRAEILSFFTAQTYLMVENSGLKMGVWIGYSLSEKYGILKVVLEAWIDGRLELSTMPFQALGSLTLYGNAELSAGPVSLGISVEANVTAEAPKPLSIIASLTVQLKTPVGKPKATIKLKWKKTGKPPYAIPLSPLLGIEHRKVTKNWNVPKPLKYLTDDDKLWLEGQIDANAPIGKVPLVPPDVQLVLNFDKPVEDAGIVGSNPAIKPADEKVGDYRLKYALQDVTLEYRDTWNESSDDGNWDDYETYANSEVDPGEDAYQLTGTWQFIPGEDQNTKLVLNATTPFEISRVLEDNDIWMALLGVFNPEYPCVTIPEEKWTCVDFERRPLSTEFPLFVEDDFIFFSDFPMNIHKYDAKWLGTKKALNTVSLFKTIECLKIWLREETGEIQITTIDNVMLLAGVGDGPYIKLTKEFSDRNETEFYVNNQGANLPASIHFPELFFQGMPHKVYIRCINTDASGDLFVAFDKELNVVDTFPASGTPGKEITVELKSETEPIRMITVRAETIRILEICYEVRRNSDYSNILVVMPADMTKVEVHFAKNSSGTVYLYDREENEVEQIDYAIAWDAADEDVSPVELAVEDQPFRSFLVTGIYKLIRVCGVTVEDAETFSNNSQISEHLETQIEENWGKHTAQILHPNKYYRLKIETSASRKKNNGDWADESFEEYMYFKTGNPPGPPSTLQAAVAAEDRYDQEAPLDDLTAYVDYTIPAGAAANESQLSVYRSYDVGVVFNDSYIDQMYQMAGLPITVRFLDNNNLPVLDGNGNIVELLNEWGDNPELAETREETQYKDILDEADCVVIAVGVTSQNQQELIASSRDLLLRPQIQYRAQMVAGGTDSIYEFAFITSRYANFLHHMHSFIDAVWDQFVLFGDPAYIVDTVALTQVLGNSEDEHIKFEQLMTVFGLNPRNLPARTEVALVNDGAQSYGLLFESPEALDWDRMEIGLSYASKPAAVEEFDGKVKIVGGNSQSTGGAPENLNKQWVDILVMETVDLSGYAIEYLPVNAADGEEYETYYEFGSVGNYNAGTQIRIYCGADPGDSPDDFEHVNLYADKAAEAFGRTGDFIRLKDGDDEVRHTRPIYRNRAYAKTGVNLVRNEDGTRFFAFVEDGGQKYSDLQTGIFRLEFTFKRDIGAQSPLLRRFGFSDPEETYIEFSLPAFLPVGS